MTASTVKGKLSIKSLDAVNFNPITVDFPVGNPLPASYNEAVSKARNSRTMLCPEPNKQWTYR